MSKEKPKKELTPEQQCIRILTARTGWGRSQTAKFYGEMLPPERDALVKCALDPAHAVAAQSLLNEISDAVRGRRGDPPPPRPEPVVKPRATSKPAPAKPNS